VASFGEKLKREREKQKITLDEVALATKIGTRLLRALEEEKFDQLPGGVFNKGFVRAYARHLGLDEERTLADYNRAAAPAGPPPPDDVELRAIAEKKERERQGRPKPGLPWGWVAFLLLMVALALAVWGFYSREGTGAGSPARLAVPVRESRQPSARETAAAQGASIQPTSSMQPNPPAITSATAEGEGEGPLPSGSAATPATTEFEVVIRARQDSWLLLIVDGKTVFHDVLAASGEKAVRAQKTLVVRAGSVGDLDISFNGNQLPVQGETGQVKTLTFGADGLMEPPPGSQLPE
jgi:cytoskeleton protein RodZ